MTSDKRPASVRVMRIISRMNVGGPSIHVVLLNAGLEAGAYETILVSGAEGDTEGSLRDLADDSGLRVETIPELGREINPRGDMTTLLTLYRLMRRERPHVVHTHMAKAGFVGRVAARMAGVPVIVHTFHGHVFHGYFSPRKTKFFLNMERYCARLSTRIITISPRLRQEIVDFGVTTIDKIEVIPLGLQLDRFVDQPRGAGEFRRDIGAAEDAILIGAVGRLVPIKNIELLLSAFAMARQEEPRLHLVLVGDGELRQSLEATTRAMGIAAQTTFAGWRRDLPSVYADLDAVVISSINEGTPASLIEAMAAGCPVVATRVGGVPDLVEDRVSGRLVAPADEQSLADAILAVVREPAATERMAVLARERARDRHQAGRLVADMDQLYRRLLAEAGITFS